MTDEDQKTCCDCEVKVLDLSGGELILCPLHAAAAEMLAELKRVKEGLFNLVEMNLVRPKEQTLAVANRISALIAKAEGK